MKTATLANSRRMRMGLTLGEMLVVLAVFCILAVMFFFSSSHAIVKTRLSRVMQEERVISRALQNYEMDFQELPTQQQGLERLQGPIAYLAHVPVDPFTEASGKPQEYLYIQGLSPAHRGVIVSVGPDGYSEFEQAVAELEKKNAARLSGVSVLPQHLLSPKEAQELIARFSYDPTNGSISEGDIITPYMQ